MEVELCRDREGCSRESMIQPTWPSTGGLLLCRVFFFRGVWFNKAIIHKLKGNTDTQLTQA